jgi:hypothetical protein
LWSFIPASLWKHPFWLLFFFFFFLLEPHCFCLWGSIGSPSCGAALSASKTYRNMWKCSIFQIPNHMHWVFTDLILM